MDQWSLFLIALIIGGALLAVAALADRASRARARATLASTPRDVPGHNGEPPSYIPADDLLGRPVALATLTQEEEDVLADDLVHGARVSAGWASDRFATHSAPVRAILRDPIVLVVDDLGPLREMLTPLQRARQLGRPLVLITGEITPETLDTLVANRVRLDLGLLVVKADAAARADIAKALGTNSTSRTDLQAGWLPPEILGGAKVWVTTARSSSFIPGTLGVNPQPSRQG